MTNILEKVIDETLAIVRELSDCFDVPQTSTETLCPSAKPVEDFDTYYSYCESKVDCAYKVVFRDKFYCKKELETK